MATTKCNSHGEPAEEGRFEIGELMDRNIMQLKAMLTAIYGGGAESFNDMSVASQSSYLWAVHDKLEELEKFWSYVKRSAGEEGLVAISRAMRGPAA